MRVFVAGASGAIGVQLVPRLVASGHEVHGMTRHRSKEGMLQKLGAVPVVADALDPDQVAEAVARVKPEVIVHELTAIGALDTRHFDRDFALTNRLRTEGTDHLLSAGHAMGVERFVAQSISAFGAYARQRDELARRFFAAAEHGDLAGLEALLTHEVMLTGDGGGKAPALARSVHGQGAVARTLINWFRLGARLPNASARPVEVNGGPGALILDAQQRLLGVLALDMSEGQIASIWSIVNPEKLSHLGPVGDFGSLLRSAAGG